MIYENKKINIFLTVVIFCILLVSLLLIVFGDIIKKVDNDKTANNGATTPVLMQGDNIREDIEELKEFNKDVVMQAKKITSDSVGGVGETDHYQGDINAPVEFIVYCDFKNPLCTDFLETIEMAKIAFGDKMVVAFRHFFVPTSTVSRELALASECASDQGKFWEMHDELFKKNSNVVNDSIYKELSKKIPFKKVYFDKCMEENRFRDKIESQIQDGIDFGVLGTPSSFINGEKIPGSYSFEDFTDSSGRSRLGVKSIIEKYLQTE